MSIIFKFSSLYESALRGDEHLPLTWERAELKIKMLEQFWCHHGSAIVAQLEYVTKLSFKTLSIPCYINSKESFSDPLTVRVYRDDKNMQNTFVHELIHVIMTQNDVAETRAWEQLSEDYKGELPVTRVHILVHAIHLLVYEKLFPERLESIQTFAEVPAYVRSWEIVKELGAQKVVDKYLLGA